MTGDELRSSFLEYFENKAHTIVPSSSLIPHGDPTLLLNTAGMVQFKPYFLGEEKPPSRRLASCQKCFRTTDIESVGDSSHCTFFEMLGNFSIGDYFKTEAIDWAWEFVTEHLKLPIEKLWITILKDDDEAFDLWLKQGVLENRIIRLDEKDNFWGPPGAAGPCGPCSEIHYDYGLHMGCGKPGCAPGCECPRFVEIWNLVFIQYNQAANGNRSLLERPSIDTGMGLERISAVLQGKTTIFETDLLKPLVAEASKLAGVEYGKDEYSDVAVRVIAEHGRGIAFLIADGVMPGSDGRGYILRRLIRRAALYGRRLGLKQPFLASIAKKTIEHMGSIYPTLQEKKNLILDVIRAEENRFSETLTVGLELLDGLISSAGQGENMLCGKDVFKLYDTYGFPVELTCELARQHGMCVDVTGFEKELANQKARAKANQRFKSGTVTGDNIPDIKATSFVGYQCLVQNSYITHILLANKPVKNIRKGQTASLVLSTTPFYAEKGGQTGDTGFISHDGAEFKVSNTVQGPSESIIHHGYVTRGSFLLNDEVVARVDEERRKDIARNHTATHLLHISLKNILGNHAEQRGSLVSPDRLRFDFSHLKPVTGQELEEIEKQVNEMIRANLPVSARIIPFKEAMKAGAIAIFGEKYGEEVRVLSVGEPPVSTELCGGTHVSSTGEIAVFHIVSEASIGAGLRRIEAVTGRNTEMLLRQQALTIHRAAELIDTTPDKLISKIKAVMNEFSETGKKMEAFERQAVLSQAEHLATRVESINSIRLVGAKLPQVKVELLREAADYLKNKIGSGIVALASVVEDKPVFVVAVTDDLVKQGYKAGDIIKEMSRIAGGGGGGKPGLATGGGKDKSQIPEALEAVRQYVRLK